MSLTSGWTFVLGICASGHLRIFNPFFPQSLAFKNFLPIIPRKQAAWKPRGYGRLENLFITQVFRPQRVETLWAKIRFLDFKLALGCVRQVIGGREQVRVERKLPDNDASTSVAIKAGLRGDIGRLTQVVGEDTFGHEIWKKSGGRNLGDPEKSGGHSFFSGGSCILDLEFLL